MHRDLHSFPTRRSSDLPFSGRSRSVAVGPARVRRKARLEFARGARDSLHEARQTLRRENRSQRGDRKSTRLNSSHSSISYAVFCLKKKKPAFAQEPSWT